MIGGGFEYDLRTYAGDGTWLSRFKFLQSRIQTFFHIYFEAALVGAGRIQSESYSKNIVLYIILFALSFF